MYYVLRFDKIICFFSFGVQIYMGLTFGEEIFFRKRKETYRFSNSQK